MLKKIYTASFIVLAAISFSSCVKGFTCSCQLNDGQGYALSVEEDLVGTKKTAQKECDDIKEEMERGTSATAGCTLK